MHERPELPPEWTVFDDAAQLAQAASAAILDCAERAIMQRGAFHLVTAGGSTPNDCYRLLASAPTADWARWHLYMGDERALPVGDVARNGEALYRHWLAQVPLPATQVHLMRPELGIEHACRDYAAQIPAQDFDLVLLGMGEDGHTASLFPGRSTLDGKDDVLIEYNAPKPPPLRMTLSAPRLRRCREMLKLLSGSSKHEAIRGWLSGSATLPIAQLEARDSTRVYVDRAALLGSA